MKPQEEGGSKPRKRRLSLSDLAYPVGICLTVSMLPMDTYSTPLSGTIWVYILPLIGFSLILLSDVKDYLNRGMIRSILTIAFLVVFGFYLFFSTGPTTASFIHTFSASTNSSAASSALTAQTQATSIQILGLTYVIEAFTLVGIIGLIWRSQSGFFLFPMGRRSYLSRRRR